MKRDVYILRHLQQLKPFKNYPVKIITLKKNIKWFLKIFVPLNFINTLNKVRIECTLSPLRMLFYITFYTLIQSQIFITCAATLKQHLFVHLTLYSFNKVFSLFFYIYTCVTSFYEKSSFETQSVFYIYDLTLFIAVFALWPFSVLFLNKNYF